MKHPAVGLVLWVAVSMSAGLVGSQFMPGAWYAGLAKPSWNPPSWVFAPVWSTLYVMMGVAAWLVWRKAGFSGARLPLVLFLVQLVLNALWSYLFFGAHRPDLAFADIVALWLVILATTVGFWRISTPAGVLLVPYLAWVGFASALNLQLWRLNA
jgi:tryptophan-rich sensory protein